MEKLKKHIHDDSNGLDYVLVGDYYIPDLQLPEESRPIGRWGRMHSEYTFFHFLPVQRQHQQNTVIKRFVPHKFKAHAIPSYLFMVIL